MQTISIIPQEAIKQKIYFIRGEKFEITICDLKKGLNNVIQRWTEREKGIK